MSPPTDPFQRVSRVTMCEGSNIEPRTPTKKWAFDIDSLAKSKEVSQSTVRRDIAAGKLNPRSLLSVVRWVRNEPQPTEDEA